MPRPVAGDHAGIAARMVEIIGTRADHAHIAAQHVEDLRQFIEPGLAQQPSQPGDAMHLQRIIGPAHDLGGGAHGAKLDGGKRPAIPAHSFLHV